MYSSDRYEADDDRVTSFSRVLCQVWFAWIILVFFIWILSFWSDLFAEVEYFIEGGYNLNASGADLLLFLPTQIGLFLTCWFCNRAGRRRPASNDDLRTTLWKFLALGIVSFDLLCIAVHFVLAAIFHFGNPLVG